MTGKEAGKARMITDAFYNTLELPRWHKVDTSLQNFVVYSKDNWEVAIDPKWKTVTFQVNGMIVKRESFFSRINWC